MGFTSVSDDDKEKPQCVLYYAVLSNEAMKPSKLKRHLQQKHPEHMKKRLILLPKTKIVFETAKTGYFCQQRTTSVQAFFDVALQIAKHKKPHTIRETLIKPCAEHSEVNSGRNKRKENSVSVII